MRLQGERHPNAKISDAQARRIAQLWRDGYTSPELSARYGLSRQQVWRIATGKSRRPGVVKQQAAQEYLIVLEKAEAPS